MVTERDERFYHRDARPSAAPHPPGPPVRPGDRRRGRRNHPGDPAPPHGRESALGGDRSRGRRGLPGAPAGDLRGSLHGPSRLPPHLRGRGLHPRSRKRDRRRDRRFDRCHRTRPRSFRGAVLQDCQRALRPGGIYETQSGSPFYYPEEARSTQRNLREIFAHVRRYHGAVPSFNSGMCAFLTASEEPLDVSRDDLARRLADRGLDLAYYSPEVHLASGVIPAALL